MIAGLPGEPLSLPVTTDINAGLESKKRPAGVYNTSRAAVLAMIARPGQHYYYRSGFNAHNIRNFLTGGNRKQTRIRSPSRILAVHRNLTDLPLTITFIYNGPLAGWELKRSAVD
jgi:hypothetical protein